jgi:O-antigen/teichoic acid export membrane protein
MSSLIRNVKLSLITYTSQIISGSIVYIVLARILSMSDFGLLSFGITLAGLLTVTSEFGYALMAERDISQKKFPLHDYIFNAFTHKLVFSILSVLGGLIYLFAFYSGANVTIGAIFVINAVITSNNIFLLAAFRASNLYKVESLLALFYALVLVLVIICFLVFHFQVIFIAYSLVAARFLQFVILVIVFTKKFGRFVFSIDSKIQKYFLQNSYSFGAHYIIGIFYFSIDSQLIAYYSGNEALAIYQSYFRIVLILLSVSDLLNNVFLPYLSSKFRNDKAHFIEVTAIANRIVIFLGLALFLFLNLFSKDIVQLLYSEKYASALTIVIPLSFVLLFRIVCSIYAILLTISDHQNIRVIVVFVSLIINISLNFWLIPEYGYVGAAYVSMITHFILVSLYIVFSSRYLGSLFIDSQSILFLVITVLLIILKSYFHVELSFFYSALILLLWSGSLVMININKKEQMKKVADVFRGGYS